MFVFLPLFIILGSHPGCSEAMRTRSLNPSMIEGVDALLVIGKEKCEDQLLLIRFFLSQPILSLNEDFMAHSKGWVVRCTGGSAGPASTQADLLDFLHLSGSLPRKTN
jgi:hypothetical protein